MPPPRHLKPSARTRTSPVRGREPAAGDPRVSAGGGSQTGPGSRVPATEAKNRFGEMLKRARAGHPVFIERRGKPQVVLIDYEAYRGFVAETRGPDEKKLDALRAQFDELYANMQKPAARKVADRFLNASAEELNKVARRGRAGG